MKTSQRITFLASEAEAAQTALALLSARYGSAPVETAEVIVALGGDGFMLQTLHAHEGRDLAVYGMNCGTIGFLMNEYDEQALFERLRAAEETVINPLVMRAVSADGATHTALAINNFSVRGSYLDPNGVAGNGRHPVPPVEEHDEQYQR